MDVQSTDRHTDTVRRAALAACYRAYIASSAAKRTVINSKQKCLLRLLRPFYLLFISGCLHEAQYTFYLDSQHYAD